MTYTTLDDIVLNLRALDADERKTFKAMERRFAARPDWNDFANYWGQQVAALYDGRQIPRKQVVKTSLFQIGQDMEARLGIEQGKVLPPDEEDYRDDLEKLIYDHFETRREFCKATGVAEDLLSHVLAKRKHMSIVTLSAALRKIGRKLVMVPLAASRKKRVKTAS